MVKLLSAAPALAVAALLAGAHGVSAIPARALLAEAGATAPAPASAPSAAVVVKPSSSAAGAATSDMTLAADGVSFSNGKLIIKDPSDTIIKRNGEAVGLAGTASTFGAGSKLNGPSEAVVLGVTEAGAPITAIAKLSNPVLADDTLTFDAVILNKPASADGAVAATAAKAKSLVSPDAPAFKADTAAIVFDGAPAADGTAGQKDFVGAVVGAGIGDALCGAWCAAGGALAGSWW
jgi:hypothetical protein